MQPPECVTTSSKNVVVVSARLRSKTSEPVWSVKPWTVDADDIRIAGDLEDTLVYRTPSIDDFLGQRSDKFIVTATKGFGKTLLLKAQRIAL